MDNGNLQSRGKKVPIQYTKKKLEKTESKYALKGTKIFFKKKQQQKTDSKQKWWRVMFLYNQRIQINI